MIPHVGSVGVLSDAGAVSAPVNASIHFQSSGCHLKSLCFITPCSVSCLPAATDARNSVKVSPLEVLSYTELEELQWYLSMCDLTKCYTPYVSTTLLLSFYRLLQWQKKSLKNAGIFEK